MKSVTFFAASAATILTLIVAPAGAQDLGEIDKRFQAVKKVVDDPLIDEGGIRKALRELESLIKVTGELDERDLSFSSREAKLVTGIANTLKQVRSRLPAGSRISAEGRPGFPVPKYEDTELLANASSKLHEAQVNLARHLRRTGEPDDESERFLVDVSKAQENLAWEAGWPFTKQEADQVRQASRLTEEAYNSRLLRGIKRVNEQIARETLSNGRDPERPFVIHVPTGDAAKKLFFQHLEKLRSVGQLPKEARREFDGKEAEALTNGKTSDRR